MSAADPLGINAAPEVPRDRWSRPLIMPPTGGDLKPYKRVTRYIDVVEDKWNLQQWEKRMVAIGLADRDDLLLSVAAHRDDKGKVNRLCDDAKEAARGSAGATKGTALHTLTDMVDRGQKLPTLPPGPAASLAAFTAATKPLKVEGIEVFTVQDLLEAAGTADRIYKHRGQLYIGDTKSGTIDLGTLKIAMQLAIYSRSRRYDPVTKERTDHGASYERALVMHLPRAEKPEDAKCELHWIDLLAGWEAVKVARSIWEQRKVKFKDLTEPFVQDVAITIGTQIAAAATADEVRVAYQQHRTSWTAELDALARQRVAELEAAAAKAS